MARDDKSKRAGELRDQGLTLQVIASRLGISVPQASKLVKAVRRHPIEDALPPHPAANDASG
jgi:transcriptional regulator with XRE-family HTH domain